MTRIDTLQLHRQMPRILIGVVVVLFLTLVAMWVTLDGTVRNVHWVPPGPARIEFGNVAGADAGPGVLAASRAADMLARPIFAPTRRPAPVAVADAAVVAPPPDPLANIQLYGVFSGAGGAGILANVDGKMRRVLRNDSVGAWKVQSIVDRDVTFVRGEETKVMRLVRTKVGQPTAIPAGVAGTGGAVRPVPSAAKARDAAQEEVDERLRRVDAELKARGLPPMRR